MKTLVPEIIRWDKGYTHLLPDNRKNSFITLDKDWHFCSALVEESGKITVTLLNPLYPPYQGQEYYSDPDSGMLWMILGRGVYMLDRNTKETRHITVSNNGDDTANWVFLLDPVKKIFLVEVMESGWDDTKEHSLLFDFINDKVLFISGNYDGMLLPFTGGRLLYGAFGKKNTVLWQLTDYELHPLRETPLTKAMNKFQFQFWPGSRTVDYNKRIILGMDILGKSYYSLRWDEDFKEIRIEPLLLQIPKDCILEDNFTISPDGNWVQTKALRKSGIIQVYQQFFYHLNDDYPQGLSLPIPGSYTQETNPGVFIDHSTYGMCYLEADNNNPGKLYLYKMLDALKLLGN